MKKLFALLVVLTMVIGLAGCGVSKKAEVDSSNSGATVTEKPTTSGDSVKSEVGSSGKIAVIRNMSSSDHTAQFFAGCTAEGEALGYKVDTFMSDGDDVKMQDLMEQALQKDYNIWIVSHANEGYQYDLISKAVAAGIKVACFDCAGDHVDGVTYTSQDDASLAKISLDALIDKAQKNGCQLPINILEINTLGAIAPFDNRHSIVEQYEKDGKIKVIQLISPPLTGGDFYSQVNTAVSTALNNYSDIQGVWSASSAFLDGVFDAMDQAANTNIVVTAIDISDTEIQRLANKKQYYCCAAVDPYVIGVVDVRLAVLKTLGVDTPELATLDAVGVFNNQVTADDNMKTLSNIFPGFGTTDLFDTKEIKDLRSKFSN